MSLAAQANTPKSTMKPAGSDLRQHTRIVCIDGSVLRLAVRPEFRGRKAIMLDISAGGIGLVMKEPVEASATLVFELIDDSGANSIGRLARVRHCRPHPVPAEAPWLPKTPVLSKFFRSLLRIEPPKPEGHAWFVGCEFDRPLSEAEMKVLFERLQAVYM